jgi:PRC-barrel domain
MKKAMILASAAMISIALLSGGAGGQGTPQTVELVKVDVHKLAAGYRASKVIGSSVINDANETIGKIDDLLVSSDGKQPMPYCRSVDSWAWALAWLSCLTTR